MQKNSKKLSQKEIRAILSDPSAVIHFVGIGGVSTSSLASLLLARGYRVSGSDNQLSPRLESLRSSGAAIHAGHDPGFVRGSSLVVYSHAISQKNPELIAAHTLGIPSVSRSELLGALMLDYPERIGVSGTHGKSTVTAMLDSILSLASQDPTTLCGADLTCGSPLRMGGDGILLYEACEYKDSFLDFHPTVAVGLNIEYDHADYFPDLDSLCRSFIKAFSSDLRFCVLNADDAGIDSIIPYVTSRSVTFGRDHTNDYTYKINGFTDHGYGFSLERAGRELFRTELPMIGIHNVYNATAAAVTAIELGVDPMICADALAGFRGIGRRLQRVGERRGRPVYYDYAHHPTEIKVGINALRMSTHGPITVIFQPHTYSRTKALWQDFVRALSLADRVILTDIYPAREDPIEGVSSRALAESIGECATFSSLYDLNRVIDASADGAIVVMGAGDMEAIRNITLERL